MEAYEESYLEMKHDLRSKSFLVVSEDNFKAQSFYRKLGYKELFPMNSLFRKGVTEILMKKDIIRKRLVVKNDV